MQIISFTVALSEYFNIQTTIVGTLLFCSDCILKAVMYDDQIPEAEEECAITDQTKQIFELSYRMRFLPSMSL